MRFYILTKKSKLPSRPQFPYATLKADDWDDYGYRTTYEAVIHTSHDTSVDLGAMKILEIDQTSGSTPMPKSPFRSLGANFCSLGHSLEYYETLYKLGPALREAYLRALGDVAWDELRRAEFEDLEGYRVSLLRFSGAERLVEEAARFLRQTKKSLPSKRRGFAFNVKTQLGKSGPPLVAKFSFTRRGQLPHRVNAIIGYNGPARRDCCPTSQLLQASMDTTRKRPHEPSLLVSSLKPNRQSCAWSWCLIAPSIVSSFRTMTRLNASVTFIAGCGRTFTQLTLHRENPSTASNLHKRLSSIS